MKQFLLHLAWLLTIPCLLLFASQIRERYIWETIFDGNEYALCVGDSHAQPIKLNSGPTIARGGDPFLISVLTVKRLMQYRKHNIRDVYLTVGPQSFSSLPESRISEDFEDWFSANGRRIANRLSLSDYLNLSKFDVPVLQHFRYELSLTNKGVTEQAAIWNGAFRQNADIRAKNHRVANSKWFEEIGFQKKHLEQLIELCEDRNVNLFLVGTPLHSSYRSRVEKTSWKKYKSFLHSLDVRHSNVHYLSYEEELLPDSLFRDSDHLNSLGGEFLGKRLEMTANARQLP